MATKERVIECQNIHIIAGGLKCKSKFADVTNWLFFYVLVHGVYFWFYLLNCFWGQPNKNKTAFALKNKNQVFFKTIYTDLLYCINIQTQIFIIELIIFCLPVNRFCAEFAKQCAIWRKNKSNNMPCRNVYILIIIYIFAKQWFSKQSI